MDLNRITAASNWIVNARTAIARRYVCSTSAAERLDCLRSVAKALAFPGSSRLCRRLPPGEERVTSIILEKKIYMLSNKLLTRFRFAKKFESSYQVFPGSLNQGTVL